MFREPAPAYSHEVDRLPNGWRRKYDSQGREYFLDDVSEQTTWIVPTSPTLPEDWEVRYDDLGRKYFANHRNQTTQWKFPGSGNFGYFSQDSICEDDILELPSYNSAVAGDFPGRYESRSAIAGPSTFKPMELLRRLSANYDTSKDTTSWEIPVYNDNPPSYDKYKRREKASCYEIMKRQGPNFYFHAFLCVGFWVLSTFMILEYHFAGFIGTLFIVGAVYLLMNFAGYGSPTMLYLKNVKEDESPYEYVESLKKKRGTIEWSVCCYHYEMQTQTYTNRVGKTVTETYKVRVNTHRASTYYQYQNSRDISKSLEGLEDYRIMQIHSECQFGFANEEIRQHYNNLCSAWKAYHNLDSYQEFHTTFNVADMVPYALWEREPGALPGYLKNPYLFMMVNMLSFGFLFRLWFDRLCGHLTFVCEKEISGIVHNSDTRVLFDCHQISCCGNSELP